MRNIFILGLLIVIAFSSCEKLLMPKEKSEKPIEVFEELWKTLDKGYTYFDYKGVRWDSVYMMYRPKISDTMTERALYDTCVQMINLLRDGSVSLNAGFATSFYNTTGGYAANFRKDLLERTYWKGYERTGPFMYKVIDSVGYIYYGSFNDDVNDAQIDVMIDFLKGSGGTKGTILDIRNNTGGKTENMYTMFNHLGIDSSFEYSIYLFATAYKNGVEHDAISDFIGSYIENNDKRKFGRRTVVLTNRANYGVASLFATAAKGFTRHRVRVMGDTTGGGGTIPASYELPNGWIIKYPTSIVKDADGSYIENGVAPDTVVTMKPADEALNKDSMIDAALAEILK
jgi:hypothetical protein